VLYPLSYEGLLARDGNRRVVGTRPPVGLCAVGKLTVLVIDDDPVILELLRVNFEIEGFDVICATDGEDGLRRAQADRPDIVISDIMMPRRDGLQLLTELKADPSTEDLPVILLSAKAQKSEVQHGIDMGADDYITKPFDPLELIDRLNAVMARPRG
jgi:DNA-binding response OmpR family regulator